MRERYRAWLEATHSALFELHRHYARQLFQSDLITSPEDLRRVIITCLAGVASIGFVVPKLYYKKYEYLGLGPNVDLYRRAIYSDQLFFVVMTMLGIAALVTFRWDSLFPNREDYLILRPLPLKLSQIYFAKLTTLSALTLLVIALLTIPCAFSFASVISGNHDLAPSWQEMAAQVVATFCAGIFVVFALALLQGLLMNCVPLRWYARVSASMQSLLLVAVLCAIPWAVDLPNAVQSIDLRPAWSSYAPPLWYFAIYEELLGRADSYDSSLAVRGAVAAALALGGTILVSAVSHRRYARRIFESEVQTRRSRLRVVEWLAERLSGESRESAILLFALRSLDRMKQHRMIRLVYAGVGCALVLESGIGVILTGALNKGPIHRGAVLDAVFALPLMLFFFLFTGLRYAFRIPVDLRANWLFRLTAQNAITERRRAVRLIYIGFALLPALAATGPFLLMVMGPWRGLYAIAFAGLIAALIIENELENTDTIPLTCSYLPGKRNILHTGIIYWFVVFVITTVLTALEAIGGANSVRAALVIVMLSLLAWRRRPTATVDTLELRFDDLPEPAVATLGLSGE
ncbi:MAG TPA: hypothetical protein VNX88_08215 [Terriglobales bacterium]|jgi:hypothetical protein|nr:hypothetical protein [Terriglobales bacterium]